MLSLAKKKYVYTYAVSLAIIIIINLYFSKENNYDRCVVIKTSGVHWLNAVFLENPDIHKVCDEWQVV